MPSQRTCGVAMVLSIAGLYFFSFFQRVAIPGSLFNDILSDFTMSASDVTRLSAIYLFVYAAMQPFAGYMADRWGGIRVTLASGVLFVIGSTLFPLADSKWSLYGSRALVGLGASTMYLCMVKETDHYFGGRNFAPIFGLLCMLGYTGGLVGTRPFATLAATIGWRQACLASAAATGLILVFAWLVMRKLGREEPAGTRTNLLESFLAILRNARNYPILVTIPLCFSMYFSIQATIGPKFLQDFCGLSALSASNYTFCMMLAIMAMLLLSGFLSKWSGNRRKIFLVFNGATTALSMAVVVLGIRLHWSPAVFLAAFLASATAAGCTPVNAAFMRELNPPKYVAVSVGLFNTVTYIMVAVMSQAVGHILDCFKADALMVNKVLVYPAPAYLAVFCTFAGLSLVAVVVSCFSRETHGRNISDPEA